MSIPAAARPVVTVQLSDAPAPVRLPSVFLAPIRADVVHFVHTNMNKNHRQAYAVNKDAGMKHSAESWGTGRAVSRIPRVQGSGTHRAGQAAFGNMCRKGRMFAPTKTWRKWHRKINVNQRRFAVASALAASAVPSLVMARGHRISDVAEVPLVIGGAIESMNKTSKAVELLQSVGAFADVEKAKSSRKIRTGRGKLRGRRHVIRRGPLIVYNKDDGISQAFRNLPGVDLQQVDRLNLLELAPGGHLGRFIMWTESAFNRLDDIFGTNKRASSTRSSYRLPRSQVTNADVGRIINSDEIQSVIRAVKVPSRRWTLKKNPLKNLGAMIKLNPYALTLRRQELLSLEACKSTKSSKQATKVLTKKKSFKSQQKKFLNTVLLGQ